MENNEIYLPALDDDAFSTPLRNIRILVSSNYLTIDLIPSVTLKIAAEIIDPDFPPELNKILAGSFPIVESKRFLRAHFDGLAALIVQEEFIDIVTDSMFDDEKSPSLKNSKAPYPFLLVENSLWRQKIPDYQGGDNLNLKHYKIVSMETCLDVIAHLTKFEWIDAS